MITSIDFEHIKKVMNMDHLPSRLRFMLLDRIDIGKSARQPKAISESRITISTAQTAELERIRPHHEGDKDVACS
jgi:translation initiation factor 4G